MRAFVAGLPCLFAFLAMVTVYARHESAHGLVGLVRRLPFPDRDLEVVFAVLVLPAAALRWLWWSSREAPPVAVRVRAAALLGAGAAALLVAAAVGAAIPRLVVPGWGFDPGLSRACLVAETASLLACCVVLATAPAGLVRSLLARPVHALLVVPVWCLAGPGLPGWSWLHSRWADVGWGRLLLLATGVALGFVAGGRLAARSGAAPPIPDAAERAGRPGLPSAGLLLLLCATLGWPSPPLWTLVLRKSLGLGRDSVAERFIDLCKHDLDLPGLGLLQVVLAAHLARAWQTRHRPVGEALLAAAVGLQACVVPLLLVPRALEGRVIDLPLLLVPPWLAIAASVWGALTVGLLCLRARRTEAEAGAHAT